jgi:hypothetical protein
VKAWLTRAGQHAEQVHEQLVQQPRDLGKSRPTRFVPSCKRWSCGWPWRCRSRLACGSEAL